MDDTEKQRFAGAIYALASAFATEATKDLARGYWMGLRDLSMDAVETACWRSLRECQFMPKVAELRTMAGDTTPPGRALLAWSAVERAAKTIGGYRSVDFGDPVIHATIRHLGGWSRLCSLPSEDFHVWARKDFCSVYTALMASGISPESARYLAGRCEASNAALGTPPDPPTMVSTGLPPHGVNPVRIMTGEMRALEAHEESDHEESSIDREAIELVRGLSDSLADRLLSANTKEEGPQ